jgi:hypothetical protein
MANKKNKWTQPAQPPPPLFLGKKERDLVKQVNDEVIERVVGQAVIYYPISVVHTDFHPIYGEAVKKTFLSPIRVYALVEWGGYTTEVTNFGVDRRAQLTVNFHRRRLTEDQDLFVREGDFVQYDDQLYEILTVAELTPIFGQVEHFMEVQAKCIKAREGLFNGK